MTRQNKERLLGGLLLVAIAAIFLPMLFDGEGVRQGRLQTVIPPAPSSETIIHFEPQNQPHPDTEQLAEPQPAPKADLAPLPAPIDPEPAPKMTAQSQPQSAEATPEPRSQIATEKPVLDRQGVPTGWTLQLASFKDRANAQSLQQKLVKRGYKAYLRDKGELTKVFVGPDLQKSVIEGLKLELKRELKLEGLVLRFKP